MTDKIRHDWALDDLRAIHDMPLLELVFRAATVHRQHHDPREMQVSKLISIKTGACPEDCAYCAQSSRYSTGVAPERLMDKERVLEIAGAAKDAGVSRVCLGAAWRSVRDGDQFDRVLDVNLKGAWNFCKSASRTLMKTGGTIVNIGSIVGLTGNAGQSNYAASKAALVGLTKSLAKELAGRKVRVNLVAPGYVRSDMTAAIADEAAAAKLKESIPLGRIGEPTEIAHAVDYLVGPGGAYVTGQVLVVDGGLSL